PPHAAAVVRTPPQRAGEVLIRGLAQSGPTSLAALISAHCTAFSANGLTPSRRGTDTDSAWRSESGREESIQLIDERGAIMLIGTAVRDTVEDRTATRGRLGRASRV